MMARDERSLRGLVGCIGCDFRRRALPPAIFYLLMLAGLLAAWFAGRAAWPLLAVPLLLSCGVLVAWGRRQRRVLLAAYVAGALLLLLFQSPWSGLDGAGVERVAAVASGLALLQLAMQATRMLRLARGLQARADALDDAMILAMLPMAAAEEARRWQTGDESKAAELTDVVRLAVLYRLLQDVAPRDRPLRRALYG